MWMTGYMFIVAYEVGRTRSHSSCHHLLHPGTRSLQLVLLSAASGHLSQSILKNIKVDNGKSISLLNYTEREISNPSS